MQGPFDNDNLNALVQWSSFIADLADHIFACIRLLSDLAAKSCFDMLRHAST